MSKPKQNPTPSPGPAAAPGFDWCFAAAAMAILALRSSFIETPLHGRAEPTLYNTPEAISLALTTVLFLLLLVRWTWRLLSPGTERIRSGLTLAAGLFAAAALCTVFVASDKRAALSEAAAISVPILLAASFVEVFRDFAKLRLLIWVLAALGAMTVYQEYSQYAEDNEMLIRSYEENPEQTLEHMGIEPGTLEHWQFEHRLRSKDIRGFLRTSNSTGSFLLLGFFGTLGLAAQSWRARARRGTATMGALQAIFSVILLGGVVMSRSRGAIVAGALGLAGFGVCMCFGGWLWPRRRSVAIAALAVVVLGAGLVIGYGVTHGRLPGPNALLVRWQYWQSTAAMIADHPLLGVGAGNFSNFYPHYKIPAAPETVQDPHNFVLAILAQYGLIGFAAFAALFILPLIKLLGRDEPPAEIPTAGAVTGPGLWILGLTLLMLLWVRLIVSEGRLPGDDPTSRIAYYIVAYLAPAAIFAMALGLLLFVHHCEPGSPLPGGPAALGLGWGLAAVLIHNLIDFAIFETVVWLTFWLVMAGLIALTSEPAPARPLSSAKRTLGLAAVAAIGAAWMIFIFLPPWRAGRLIQRSMQAGARPEVLLREAAATDPLASGPLYYRGQAAVDRFRRLPDAPTALLKEALENYKQALLRNPAVFYISRAIMETYRLLAETADDPAAAKAALGEAYMYGQAAQRRYPGSDVLAFGLGEIAERLGRPREALEWYRRAVEIEEAYCAQFAVMYPGYELFSRLGQERYEYARDYIRRQDP